MPSWIGPWEIGIFPLLMIVPAVFYLLALQAALQRCLPQNRTMAPGLVWLQLIPLFVLVWQFFVVIALGKSLENEYRARGLRVTARPGQSLGIAMASVTCALALFALIPSKGVGLGWLTGLLGLAAVVLWIVYWVRIHEYSARLVVRPQPFGQAPYPPEQPPYQAGPAASPYGDFCTACGRPTAGARYCQSCGQEQQPLQGGPS